jgi:hypothetical protein
MSYSAVRRSQCASGAYRKVPRPDSLTLGPLGIGCPYLLAPFSTALGFDASDSSGPKCALTRNQKVA